MPWRRRLHARAASFITTRCGAALVASAAPILGVAFLLHLVAFWDAPRAWMRAHKHATVAADPLYHALNWGILGLLAAGGVLTLLSIGPELPRWSQAPAVAFTASVIGILGLAFAVWTKLHLADWFAPTAAAFDDQQILTDGPYRFTQHPMYVGWWLFLTAFAVAASSWVLVVSAAVVAPMLVALARRERRHLEAQVGNK